MLRYVKINKFSELSGYTPAAIYIKINRKVWREGKEYIKAPDGVTLINVKGVETWVESMKE